MRVTEDWLAAQWALRLATTSVHFVKINFPSLVILNLYIWSPCLMSTSFRPAKTARESIHAERISASICRRPSVPETG